jgi:predicted MPP superfamily phosphohydrolase
MRRPYPTIAHLFARMESVVFAGGWPFSLARAVGRRPAVRIVRHDIGVGGGGSIALPPLRVAYASDFHVGPTTDPAVLRLACQELTRLEPDVLLLGGDFVTLHAREADWLIAELGEIPAPFGRLAVLGNNDWWGGAEHIAGRLQASGIEVLTNRNTRLRPPFDRVWVCGIDDHWCGHPDASTAFAGADGIRIVLMHTPSGLLDIGDERFELALCGHTHGGQIALPGGVPILLPPGPLIRRYSRGRFQLDGGGTLIVSVGVGAVLLPIRMFTSPEIILCTLASAEPA